MIAMLLLAVTLLAIDIPCGMDPFWPPCDTNPPGKSGGGGN